MKNSKPASRVVHIGRSTLFVLSALTLWILIVTNGVLVPKISAQSGSVIINEVESNPPGNDNYLTVIEQVELFNPTSNPIDIGGWTMNAMGGASQESITIESGTAISPGGYFIVGRGAQWLDNSAETVVLRNANGDQIVSAGPFDDDANDSRSWQRYPNGGDSWAFRTSTIGTSNGAPAPQNVSPTANAGSDQQVNEGKSVTLDGSASSDSDGSITSYSWAQSAGPAVLDLTAVSSISPTFTAPMVSSDTTVTFMLTVTDNGGAKSEDSVNITVKNVNTPPTANAGPDQQVNEGNIVTLDGGGSLDSDGTIAAYAWSQTSGPSVTLSSISAQKPSFNAPAVTIDTTLAFRLVVTDNDGAASSADTVSILVRDVAAPVNHTPTANAGPDMQVNEGTSQVMLDGSGSSDPDGTIAAYAWSQTLGPSVTLSSMTAQKPTFTTPTVTADTTLTFRLVVTDNLGTTSAADSVNVLIKDVPPAAVNHTPTANAGPDQTQNENTVITLTGASSSDPDAGDTLSYSWTQTSGPSITLSSTSIQKPSFMAPQVAADTHLVFALIVTDSHGGSSSPDTVDILVKNVNHPPIAIGGSDQVKNELTLVVLDGTGSSDSDGTIASYSWTQTAGPSATLSDSTDVQPVFTAPSVTVDTTLTFRLIVTDNDGAASTADSVNIIVKNIPPTDTTPAIVRASPLGGTYNSPISVTLTTDEPATIYYSITGNTPTTSSPQYAGPIPLSSTTTLRYFAKDLAGNSSPIQSQLYTISIPALPNGPPTANAGADFAIEEHTTSVQLQGSGTDTGSIISYFWEQVSGPMVTLSGGITAIASFDAPPVSANTDLTFKLTVTEKDGETATDTVIVTIKHVNQTPVVRAGADHSINEGTLVSLDGSGSFDPDGGPSSLTYSWLQTAGTKVTLSGTATARLSFMAPDVGSTGETLVFELTISDGLVSSKDSITITVNDVASYSVQQTSELPSDETSGELQQSSDVRAALYPIAITNLQVNDNNAGQLTVSTTFNNKDIDSVPFSALIEVRQIDGVTISLQFVKGTLFAGQTLELGTLWNPPKSGPFEIRSFALSGLESPQILSPVMSKVITVNESSLTEPIPSNIQRSQNEPVCTGTAKCLDGVITRIVDGDTLDVGDIRIRLSLVDTPESYEEGYDEAKYFTSSLCPVDSRVIVDQDDGQLQDRYGRMLAKVTCGDKKVLNAELLYSGHAVISEIYCAASEFSSEDWAQDYGCAGSAPTADGTECDPSYPTVCIPSPPPDLDCDEIPYRSFKVLAPDPHRFDSDGDGIGCEGK